ncbi:MAG: 2,3-diphosphoglycerate-dependent phosphoglycerate mutase [Chlorobi bacterium]|nr:2,3-diphosphoglycerate-dependent phosphoglycerate mutase [Chlorobiota bacterium]
MSNLILLRHGQSSWNLENRFTGWVDVDLSLNGEEEALLAGKKIKNFKIDVLFTSCLKRAINTAEIALNEAGIINLPTFRDIALNERHYGDLQGLNKDETRLKYGADQVHIWRRSFDIPPPGKEAESLAMTINRVMPYYEKYIEPKLLENKNVLVVAHGNSLRAMMYRLENHTHESILNLEIPTGTPIVFEMGVNIEGNLIPLSKTILSI